MLKEVLSESWGWALFGVAAWVIFYTRFYVQWIASEVKQRSVVPVVFWYQSSVGSLMLLGWAWHTQSPLGALSQSFNLAPYSRNLIHIWREQGRLSRRLYLATHAVVAAAVVLACAVVAVTWWQEYLRNQEAPARAARQAWFWLAVGVVGQALFALRVVLQWAVTEWKRRSVVPPAFWYIGVIATVLQFLTFATRGGGEWLYALGLLATLLIYLRNIWFIHRGHDEKALPE